MLNYEMDPTALRSYVPSGTELDSWNGKTFVRMVGFLFSEHESIGLSGSVSSPFRRGELAFLCPAKGGARLETGRRVYQRDRAALGDRDRGALMLRRTLPGDADAA